MSERLAARAQVAVIGIGNILMGDEGFGVHLLRTLDERYHFEPEIQLIDGGTMGMELLGFMQDFDHLLMLDAIASADKPGQLYSFDHGEVEHYFSGNISAHEVGVQDLLFIQSLSDKPLHACHIVGVVPASLEPSLELSPIVAAKLEGAVELCLKKLEDWGIKVSRREI